MYSDSMTSATELYDQYVVELSSISGVEVSQKVDIRNSIAIFNSSNPGAITVTLCLKSLDGIDDHSDHDILLLDIDGVDCGYWNTDDDPSLKSYIPYAESALRGDVKLNRSPIFGFREICFKSEDEYWVCTRANDGEHHIFSYLKKRRLKSR